jgi:hypothetical protein
MTPKPYDTTVAMIAGNILGHLTTQTSTIDEVSTTVSSLCMDDVAVAVRLARLIVAETIRTEPEKASE